MCVILWRAGAKACAAFIAKERDEHDARERSRGKEVGMRER